ncbi:VOC family protein [Ktedonospora formicarum]|uniref:VOC domain-containing protein n=1 Tax=Ktedonospora formicarum TaxID=2778364 RepID=A0A8J3IDV3_9CHLR|nr:hypothetical protein [Ktedonospora formicarum]GHO49509.1 hypothetical protein KSX_76720 [Ktedonospora formicarum]
MQIQNLTLTTSKLSALRAFYIDTFRLPLLDESEESFTFQAGITTVTFRATEQADSVYHFAFTIPSNKFSLAYAWVKGMTEPLVLDGKDAFPSKSWGSDSVYFYDPAGNNVEFIAMPSLANDAPGPFDPAQDLLSVSEIGVPVRNVASEVGILEHDFGQTIFRDSISEKFAAVGDDEGRLIVVEIGRPWFPTTVGVVVAPVTVRVSGSREARYSIEGLPFTLEQVASQE